MAHTFAHRTDALAAGYTRGGSHCVIEHRGIECRSVDVSGGNSFGYDYAIVCLGEVLADHADMTYTADKNLVGNLGCFGSLYAPGVAADAMARAVVMIDAHLAANPTERPHVEQVAEAKASGPTAPMYLALCAAVDAGHPGVRRSKGSGEPVFEDTRFGRAWSHPSAQLDLLDATFAARQPHSKAWVRDVDDVIVGERVA